MITRDNVLDQLDIYWQYSFMPRLEGMTDEEYLWEPVPGCWSVRTGADGRAAIDWSDPVPDPPPVTTIAWRLSHIVAHVLAPRVATYLDDDPPEPEEPPTTADDAIAWLGKHYGTWREGAAAFDENLLQEPVGDAEGQWADQPMAALLLHINREVVHHGAEIALLRDLYRAWPA